MGLGSRVCISGRTYKVRTFSLDMGPHIPLRSRTAL